MSDSTSTPESLLRRLEFTVIRKLDGLLHGDYRTLFRGSGIDLADLREYQPEDDVRHIDWNVTARQQTPFVRVFNEERDLTAWFLLDLSGSVHFGSGSVRKDEVARELVAVLARLLTMQGNRVGGLFYGNRVDGVLNAAGGRRQVLQLLHRMQRPAPPTGEPTDLKTFLERAQRSMGRRSLVFVVSDFISRPGWGRTLHALAQRHEVVAVRLYDALEMELPDLGLMTVQDAETGEQMTIDSHDPAFRRRLAFIARRREQMLREALADAGIDVLELATGDHVLESLQRFSELRRARASLHGGHLPQHLVDRLH